MREGKTDLNRLRGSARENIRRKRAVIRRKRIKYFFRRLLGLILLLVVLSGISWVLANIYAWGSEFYTKQREIYQGYLQRKELRQASYDARFNSYTNILVVGLDEGKEYTGKQADSIQLVSIDQETGKIRIIIIPRYTLTNIPGCQNSEAINNAYYYGGVRLVEQAVANLLGVTIHQYMTIDIATLANIVDVLDGVDVYVEDDMNYDDDEANLHIHIPKGYQKMNGDTAQKYLRYRSDELGSVGRIHRQQLFLKSVFQKLASSDSVIKLPQLIDLYNDKISSTAEVYDSAEFLSIISNIQLDSPEIITLPGQLDPLGSGAWIYDTGKTQEKINDFFPQPEVKETEEKGWFNW